MENHKRYKSISEVSKLLSINTHVIRYWDSKFPGISTRLEFNKQRFFNSANIRKLKELKSILYENGKHHYSLDIANKFIEKKLNKNQSNKPNNFQKKIQIVKSLENIARDLKKIANSL